MNDLREPAEAQAISKIFNQRTCLWKCPLIKKILIMKSSKHLHQLNLKMKSDTAHNVTTLLLEELIRNSVHPIVEKDIQNLNAIHKRAELNGGRMQNSLTVL